MLYFLMFLAGGLTTFFVLAWFGRKGKKSKKDEHEENPIG